VGRDGLWNIGIRDFGQAGTWQCSAKRNGIKKGCRLGILCNMKRMKGPDIP